MTHGSNSRIGIAAGRAAVGAKVEAVMSNSWGISRPRLRRASPRKGSDSRSKKTDHSGATVPDLHRLPSATRLFTIRPLAALSIERVVDRRQSGRHDASVLQKHPDLGNLSRIETFVRTVSAGHGASANHAKAIREETEWAIQVRRRVQPRNNPPERFPASS